jgi:hypothetical protein
VAEVRAVDDTGRARAAAATDANGRALAARIKGCRAGGRREAAASASVTSSTVSSSSASAAAEAAGGATQEAWWHAQQRRRVRDKQHLFRRQLALLEEAL